MYGIGPGCTFADDPTGSSPASPPVRLRELAEAFPIDAQSDFPGLYSICEDDYSPALRDIAEQVKAQFTPGCIAACVKDTNRETDVLDPNCQVWESNDDGTERNDIAECEFKGGAWEDPSGTGLCYALLTDASGVTTDADDDMSVDAGTGEALCAAHGNVEVMILRTKAPRDGWRVKATCELEADVESYCPNLK